MFEYEKSKKISGRKNFLNFQDYLLVGARGITRLLYYTTITPHQVIFFSMLLGILASFLIVQDSRQIVFIGAVCLFYKNVLDKVDGSLARAKGITSRRGRFYDSLADFVVSFSVFSAIALLLFKHYHFYLIFVLCFLSLLTSMFQCSFFIYYQVAFIKFTGGHTVNRFIESVTEDDRKFEDKFTLFLQKIFMMIYGWQDIIVSNIDGYFLTNLVNFASKNPRFADPVSDFIHIWYANLKFLSLCSILSIGSHMFLIAFFAVIGKFEYYLFVNLIPMNILLLTAIFYHYYSAKKSLKS